MIRKLVAVIVLVVSILILMLALTSDSAANRDYIAYWAAGRQLVHGANPYDADAIASLEKSAGFQETRPLLMRNPPFALFLAWPLGLMGIKSGAICWLLAILGSWMLAIRLLWIMHGRPEGRLHLAGYAFAPALACLLAGQTGAFLLLGWTLFLFYERRAPFLAGCALSLLALKPHLFLVFAAAFLPWSWIRRPRRVWAGLATGLGACALIAGILRPAIWTDYAVLLRTAGIEGEFIPTLSVLTRIAIDANASWLQFVPAVVGCGWAAWYFWRHRANWDWRRHGCFVMLVSIWLAPYAWFTDETVLLPAVLAGLYSLVERGRSAWSFAIPGAVALVEVVARVPLASGYYVWTSTAWLAWYLYVTPPERARRLRAEAASIPASGS